MPGPPLLLIEPLHGLGAHDADAALRLRALRRAGWSARLHVLDGDAAHAPVSREAAARIAAEASAEVWVAGSRAVWLEVARALPRDRPCAWWPTLVAGAGGEPMPLPGDPLAARPEGAALAGATGARHDPAAAEIGAVALDFAPLRAANDRAPVALWDGEFVLSPGPLRGVEGDRLLGAFAAAAAARPELDLVVLADPDDATDAKARALGLGFRVHCAGHAPREAEHTWIATAAAVLLPTAAPVTAGLVLRVLAHGTPLVIDATADTAAPLGAWLASRGLGSEAEPGRSLEMALVRDPHARAASARGKKLAAGHDADSLGARLAEPVGRDAGRARRAA